MRRYRYARRWRSLEEAPDADLDAVVVTVLSDRLIRPRHLAAVAGQELKTEDARRILAPLCTCREHTRVTSRRERSAT